MHPLPTAPRPFTLTSKFQPSGDQPKAIAHLKKGLERGEKHQTLLGITGSGKTFSVAHVIEAVNRPTLVLAPNKTLAAQLYGEFKALFPNNGVEYFVSYYDYYQPEAYVPSSDTFIEKDSLINEQIDRLRHAATRSLLERNDVIIVASVSCIYGIGSSEAYEGMLLQLSVGQEVSRRDILRKLVEIQYDRSDVDFRRGTFRVRGDVIDVFPAYEDDTAIRIEMFGDEVEAIAHFDPLRGTGGRSLDKVALYPASHYVTPKEKMEQAIANIRLELADRLAYYDGKGRLLEGQRLEQRTQFDVEMMEEIGRCKGIENYSRHLSGRAPGEPPPTLLEYFPKEWLLIVDESHVAMPQVRGMYRGDRARKETLVDHGFRLPSAMDNRPLRFDEFADMVHQVIYVSATPGDYELEQSVGVVEQIIRPTGLLDPLVEVRPAAIQVDSVLEEIRIRAARDERVLVTVLTKRMAQELTSYYKDLGVRARYLHSDIDTLERHEILRDLRNGSFDVLIGINLLREGLDLPEVSLVCIMEADKEGFLRNERSLIQTIGRASRNANGTVILYADRVTNSMKRAMSKTAGRRALQMAYNEENGITPQTIVRPITNPLDALVSQEPDLAKRDAKDDVSALTQHRLPVLINNLRKKMKEAAARLAYEEAAELRDRIKVLEKWAMEIS